MILLLPLTEQREKISTAETHPDVLPLTTGITRGGHCAFTQWHTYIMWHAFA